MLSESKNWKMHKLFENDAFLSALDSAIQCMVNFCNANNKRIEDLSIETIVDKTNTVRATCK